MNKKYKEKLEIYWKICILNTKNERILSWNISYWVVQNSYLAGTSLFLIHQKNWEKNIESSHFTSLFNSPWSSRDTWTSTVELLMNSKMQKTLRRQKMHKKENLFSSIQWRKTSFSIHDNMNFEMANFSFRISQIKKNSMHFWRS